MKLKPQTTYKVRVTATNDVGVSKYSSEVETATMGVAPGMPQSPTVDSSGIDTLSLSWIQRTPDEVFSLEMIDPTNEYGFIPVFHGKETSYTCTGLKRNTEYKFRVRSRVSVLNLVSHSNVLEYYSCYVRPITADLPSRKSCVTARCQIDL